MSDIPENRDGVDGGRCREALQTCINGLEDPYACDRLDEELYAVLTGWM